ncbi:MAG: hypothetical protein LAP61_05515 [Acidobacteriia bacterium]|nr:hypothetical protein [Terriglobia bacterium]
MNFEPLTFTISAEQLSYVFYMAITAVVAAASYGLVLLTPKYIWKSKPTEPQPNHLETIALALVEIGKGFGDLTRAVRDHQAALDDLPETNDNTLKAVKEGLEKMATQVTSTRAQTRSDGGKK